MAPNDGTMGADESETGSHPGTGLDRNGNLVADINALRHVGWEESNVWEK